MGVEQRARQVRLVEFPVSDGVGEPAVVGLAGELQYPARDHHRYPFGGQLTNERVHHLPGRFACDRYAASRRRTSFSCSSSRLRRFSSRSSADSDDVTPGRTPSSTSAACSQFRRHDSDPQVLRDLADRRLALPGNRHNIVPELSGMGFRHGAHPSSRAHRPHRSNVTYSCSRPAPRGPFSFGQTLASPDEDRYHYPDNHR